MNYKDFLFDIGGHRFFSKSKEVVDLWHEILPDDFIERPRLSRIYYDGKFYSYPLNAFEALSNLGVVESALCVLSYAYKPRRSPTPTPRTSTNGCRNQFGERLFSIFFKTYTEKVWGMSCDEISADWAAQRIKGLDLWSADVERAAPLDRHAAPDRRTSDKVIKTLIESFHYPRKGPGMMWDAAARQDQGAAAARSTWAASSRACRWDERARASGRSRRRPRDGQREVFTARHVISRRRSAS